MSLVEAIGKCCVKIGEGVGAESEWYHVRVRLRQGYITSPWLFNTYTDVTMKEVYASDGKGNGSESEWRGTDVEEEVKG